MKASMLACVAFPLLLSICLPSAAFKLKFLDDAEELPREAKRPFAAQVLRKTGEPVHEGMLLRSLGCQAQATCNPDIHRPGITLATLLRGIRWPDNPAFYVNLGLLPPYCHSEGGKLVVIKPGDQRDLSGNRSVICWALTMAAGKRAADEVDLYQGKRLNSRFTLPLRSHYADMQFMHAMAPRGQRAGATFALIQAWSKLSYDVASGRYTGRTLLSDITGTDPDLRVLKTYFVKGWTVSQLFDFADPDSEDIRGIALGALLHMVQDSFAGCHTDRQLVGGSLRISGFLTYLGQDPVEHARGDEPFQPRAALKGPVEYGADIIQAIRQENTTFKDIKGTIDAVFLPLNVRTEATPGVRCKAEPVPR